MTNMEKTNIIPTAAYWEGYFAVRSGTSCRYPKDDQNERADWAKGVADGIKVWAAGKVWWKSKSLWSGLGLMFVGVGLWVASQYGGSNVMMGVGGGLTAGGILQSSLRLLTRQPIYGGGGVMFQSTPYGRY